MKNAMKKLSALLMTVVMLTSVCAMAVAEILEEELVEEATIEEIVTEEPEQVIIEEEPSEIVFDAIIDDEETPLGLLNKTEIDVSANVPVERGVAIEASGDGFTEGDTVYLNAILTGYEGANVRLTWQYSTDGETWKNAEGANNDLTFAFIANETTASYYWSVLVEVEG